MSPRKLTDQDKEELLVSYRESTETTSSLAERYGVSSSTISRFLKSRLSESEYEELIQKKRLGRNNSTKKSTKKAQGSEKSTNKNFTPENSGSTPVPEVEQDSDSTESSTRRRTRRVRTRSQHSENDDRQIMPVADTIQAPADSEERNAVVSEETDREIESFQDSEEVINPDLLALAQEISIGDRQQALKELLGEDLSDLEEDDDDDDEDDDDDDDDNEPLEAIAHLPSQTEIQILPLQQAHFPKTCYVVADKMSELITRPLKDFQDLGKIPQSETSQKTLPVFDNHRVAKRFLHNRSQKVIKIPDGHLFSKTYQCLQAKGITRLLLDGQVYSLLDIT